MKTLIVAAVRCSLLFTAAAAFSLAHPASANLITNGGFETGDFTGWTGSGSAFVTGTAFGVAPHSGSFQAELISAELNQSVATTPGASYTISFFLANTGSPPNGFSVIWGGSTIFSLTDQDPFPYGEHTFTETASTASTALQFLFFSVPLPGFLDDISVEPVGVGVPDGGTTVSLLGCALLGLAAVRRKLSY